MNKRGIGVGGVQRVKLRLVLLQRGKREFDELSAADNEVDTTFKILGGY